MKTVMITGISSGLGKGLADYYLSEGWKVIGLSRRTPDITHPNLTFMSIDLTEYHSLPVNLSSLLSETDHIDLVVLNSGVLGQIGEMHELSIEESKHVVEVNVWANKMVIDWLMQSKKKINQIIGISSGAAVNGNKGWGPYSISKAALNIMFKVYAKEWEETHFATLAPGLVDTAMQDYLTTKVDPKDFPATQKMRDAKGTDVMPTPEALAPRLHKCFQALLERESGTFDDIRQMGF